MAIVLGVDSSTQSTKVEVRDTDDGALLASGRSPHPVPTPPRSEQDPGVWWEALRTAVAQTGFTHVDAISVAAQQHGMVVLDRDDAVLRPAKLWNDTESAPQAARLVDQLGPDEWTLRTGSVPVASFTITKLAWLAEQEKATFGRVGRVLLPHDWLTWRLTGRRVTDRGDASGTGYYSTAEGRWRPDLLQAVDRWLTPGDWLDRLPTVLGPHEAAGPATQEAIADLGLTGPTVVGPGTGDNMAAALGAGIAPGDVAISLGTSGTVFAVTDTPTADATGRVAGFADATGRFLPLVCVLNATLVTDTVARLLGVDRDGLASMALQCPAGADGVVLVPFLAGERTPNRPDATGTLTGLSLDASPRQVARASFEGVVCGLLDGLDALDDAGIDTGTGRLVLLGGGGRSEAYRRVLADLAGRAVTVIDGEEHVAAGACAQAAATIEDVDPAVLRARWTIGAEVIVEPMTGVDRAAVRATYAAARG